jgi:hypothetical protein
MSGALIRAELPSRLRGPPATREGCWRRGGGFHGLHLGGGSARAAIRCPTDPSRTR